MDNRMAVGTYWDQVTSWVNFIAFITLVQWYQMMHVDEALTYFTVCLGKVESADLADCTVVSDAFPTRL